RGAFSGLGHVAVLVTQNESFPDQDPFGLENIVQYAFEGGAPLPWVRFVEEFGESASKRLELRAPPSQTFQLGGACCPFIVTRVAHPGE
ncbi:hypothetical protein, partial [Streptomyces violascens]|uniref:hypothetical protein n=1 Tax=Streptomyces violascens TaxID=67381 RepID=UPI0036B3ECCB